MAQQTLKDAQYRVLGYIDTDGSGRQTLKDAQFRVLGYYYPDRDVTKDVQGRIVGYGNILGILLKQ